MYKNIGFGRFEVERLRKKKGEKKRLRKKKETKKKKEGK
jgi:hypothetical protein